MTATFVHTPLAQTLLTRPSWVRDSMLVLGGSLLVAALAQVRIPLPFTPVPLTGQTFGVMLVGAGFGSRLGFLALLLYLLEGLLGLPFFNGGGSGLSHLTGPTGGYLLAFPLAAGLMGWFVERWGGGSQPLEDGRVHALLLGFDLRLGSHLAGGVAERECRPHFRLGRAHQRRVPLYPRRSAEVCASSSPAAHHLALAGAGDSGSQVVLKLGLAQQQPDRCRASLPKI